MDISSILEVEVNEMKETESEKNVTTKNMLPSVVQNSTQISEEEKEYSKVMFGGDIASVRFLKLHCTSCNAHIGSAPAKAHNMHEHPVLKTLLCLKCREFYGDGAFEQGEDATDMFCRWCANGGNLYCCSYCSNTFCYKCIRRNFNSVVRKKIESDERWKCFVCDPRDLYTARTICRALLQHVQTVTRILQSEQRMTLKEIEEKMNLDESRCCPRTRKRKRRKTTSDSDEDDETYIPNLEDMPLSVRRRVRRSLADSKAELANGTANRISPHNPAFARSRLQREPSEDDDELPLIPFEQSLIECENETINPDDVAIRTFTSTPYNNLNSVKFNTFSNSQSSQHKKSTVVSNSISISAVPTANLLQSQSKPLATAFRKKNSKVRSLPYSSSSNRSLKLTATEFTPMPFKLQPQPRRLTAPMVTIPVQNTVPIKRARVILPRPINSSISADSNVIELNSDSDESTNKTSDQCNTSNNKAVETSSTGTSTGTLTRTSTRNLNVNLNGGIKTYSSRYSLEDGSQNAKSSCKNDVLRKVLLIQSQEVEAAFITLKKSFKKLPYDSVVFKEDILKMARYRAKGFHQAIQKTISRLSEISDTVIREYNIWRRSQLLGQGIVKSFEVIKKSKSEDIPLDMTCVRDSEPSDTNISDDESEKTVITSLVENINFFPEGKKTVNRSVGNNAVLMIDKSTQAYDVISKDYEKCIGYSLLTKANYDPATTNEVLEPVIIPDKYFGKYEEEYIYYLQHIEDHGIKMEDTEDLPNPNETPLKNLIETNSLFISEILENTESPVSNGVCEHQSSRELEKSDDNKNTNSITNKSSEEQTTILTTKVVEELAKMVTELSDDLNAEKHTTKEENSESKREGRRKQILNVKDEETVMAVRTLINEDKSNSTKSTLTVNKACVLNESDEECTIID